MKRICKQLRIHFRLLKMMHVLDRSALPLYLLYALLDALQPYVMTVSYTHLDVYKRQGYTGRKYCRNTTKICAA